MCVCVLGLATAADCEQKVKDAKEKVNQEVAKLEAPFALPTTGFLGACWGDTNDGVRSDFGDPHTGIDVWSTKEGNFLPNGQGTPVYSAYGGKVVSSENGHIEIANDPLPDAYSSIVPQLQVNTYYAHLSVLLVHVGDRPVTRGQLIGYQGNVGVKGGWPVHLHFVVKTNTGHSEYIKNTQDPTPYLGLDLKYPACGLFKERWLEPFNS
jgi:murein DD-endopeptidase MepM/ murein hydrolase activator NlpD